MRTVCVIRWISSAWAKVKDMGSGGVGGGDTVTGRDPQSRGRCHPETDSAGGMVNTLREPQRGHELLAEAAEEWGQPKARESQSFSCQALHR